MRKHLKYFTLAALTILSAPLIAMQITEEVDWKLPDFIIIGALLFSIGLAYELISQKLKSKNQRIFLSVALGMLLIYIWAELAVGIIGTPFAGS